MVSSRNNRSKEKRNTPGNPLSLSVALFLSRASPHRFQNSTRRFFAKKWTTFSGRLARRPITTRQRREREKRSHLLTVHGYGQRGEGRPRQQQGRGPLVWANAVFQVDHMFATLTGTNFAVIVQLIPFSIRAHSRHTHKYTLTRTLARN